MKGAPLRVDRSILRISSGLLMLPAIMLQQYAAWAAAQTLLMILMAVLSGRKFKPLPNIMILVSVTLANLLQPSGLVLVRLWGFAITQGALETGARKALLLVALLYISQYMVAAKPSFPGLIGNMLSMQFYYFEKITSLWHRQPGSTLVQTLDDLLLSMEGSSQTKALVAAKAMVSASRGERIGAVFALAAVWMLYLIPVACF